MAKELKFDVKEGTQILEIREGQALPLHELKSLILAGSLQAPGDFLDVRKDQFPIDKSHVIVNEDAGTITLNSYDREDIGKISVKGQLQVHPDFNRIGINDSENLRSTSDLATWIKMNRTFFESKIVAMNLVTILRNFKANISKQLESKTDDRANYSTLRQQVVESNIPESFKITVPLYVGLKPVTFDVEIVIDPDDLSCALISPDAADKSKQLKEDMINEQVARFAGYVVIYQ